MKKKLLIVSSITYAMKGQDILNRHGFNASIQRVTKSETFSSCGYGILVSKSYEEAKKILSEHGIKVLNGLEEGENEQ